MVSAQKQQTIINPEEDKLDELRREGQPKWPKEVTDCYLQQ